jgi:hypothetical protein
LITLYSSSNVFRITVADYRRDLTWPRIPFLCRISRYLVLETTRRQKENDIQGLRRQWGDSCFKKWVIINLLWWLFEIDMSHCCIFFSENLEIFGLAPFLLDCHIVIVDISITGKEKSW